MRLLSEVCDTLLDPWDPRSQDQQYQNQLKVLQTSIDSVATKSGAISFTSESSMAMKLYHVATQIYLARASQHPWESSADLDDLIDSAFSVVAQSCNSCQHFFPLLILACEARKEEHRRATLNLIDRTGRDARIRSVEGVRYAIQSVWVQQDLNADSDLLVNYTGIMNAAISLSSSAPSFA